MEPILLGLGQPKQLSEDVQKFLRVLTIGAPGYIGFESLKKYLQCQGNSIILALIDLSHCIRDYEGVDSGSSHRVPDKCRPLH